MDDSAKRTQEPSEEDDFETHVIKNLCLWVEDLPEEARWRVLNYLQNRYC